jgi:hypothetical protein
LCRRALFCSELVLGDKGNIGPHYRLTLAIFADCAAGLVEDDSLKDAERQLLRPTNRIWSWMRFSLLLREPNSHSSLLAAQC